MSGSSELAINGGPAAKTVPYGTGERFIGKELEYLKDALKQNTLFYGHGKMVSRACERMKEYTGRPYVTACTSGSAAIHLGLIAAGIGPGDEVIVTPNTDSGSVLGIIEEGAVPIFCDCEDTLQPSVDTIAARITEHTAAVEVVHLAGYPAPIDKIVEFCTSKGIEVVEDCAQSWGTTLHGKRVGSTGTAGCYSINDYKHISCGDGGFVAVSDEELYRRISNYADKHYDRLFDGARRQKYHGINYRMSELQGAVACAQLEKVDEITSRQTMLGDRLRENLSGLNGGHILAPIDGGVSSYWWTLLLLDDDLIPKRDEIVEAIQAEGVNAGSYGQYDLIQKGLFQDRIVRPWLEGARAMYPFVQPDGREYTYSLDETPNHKRLLKRGINLGMNTFFTEQDMDETAEGITKVMNALG